MRRIAETVMGCGVYGLFLSFLRWLGLDPFGASAGVLTIWLAISLLVFVEVVSSARASEEAKP